MVENPIKWEILTEFSLVSIAFAFSAFFDIFPSQFLCYSTHQIWKKRKQKQSLAIQSTMFQYVSLYTVCSCSICPSFSPNEWMQWTNEWMSVLCTLYTIYENFLSTVPIVCSHMPFPLNITAQEEKSGLSVYHIPFRWLRYVRYRAHWTHPFRLRCVHVYVWHRQKADNREKIINFVNFHYAKQRQKPKTSKQSLKFSTNKLFEQFDFFVETISSSLNKIPESQTIFLNDIPRIVGCIQCSIDLKELESDDEKCSCFSKNVCMVGNDSF